ncbi:MAG: hypothetical protein E7157_04145 [Lactobacillales bacterium]|nr:hypothetical protein [Lactobacillales bacterium]
MIKNLETLSDKEKLKMILNGSSYAMHVAYSDKEMYEKSKEGKLENIEEYQKRDINILSLLEGLGYPMDELGTYLYKDVIVEVYEIVKDVSKRTDMDKCRDLMKELNDAYSNFYRWIARDDKEMGIASFHLYIEQAISKIDEEAIDQELAIKVFGSNPEDMNYGLQAFQLASYVANHYSMKPEFNKQKIMSLSNLQKNIKLKNASECV